VGSVAPRPAVRRTGAPGRRLRLAVAAVGAAAAVLHLTLLGAPGPGGRHWWTAPWSAGPLAVPGATALLAVPALLVPALVRVLAHPRHAPLPAPSDRAARAGLGRALGALAVALAIAPTGATGRVGGPGAVALAVAAVLAVTAARTLHPGRPHLPRLPQPSRLPRRSHPVVGSGRRDRPDAAGAGPVRPDLADDLATLLARIAPGSATARAAARLNRALDSWGRTPGPVQGRTAVTAVSPAAAETVISAPPDEATGNVTATPATTA